MQAGGGNGPSGAPRGHVGNVEIVSYAAIADDKIFFEIELTVLIEEANA